MFHRLAPRPPRLNLSWPNPLSSCIYGASQRPHADVVRTLPLWGEHRYRVSPSLIPEGQPDFTEVAVHSGFFGSKVIPLVGSLLILFHWTPQAAAQPPQVPPAGDLSLPQIIRIVLDRNAGLQAALRGVEASSRGLDAAKGARLGRAEIFGDYLYAGFGESNRRRLGSNVMAMPQLRPRVTLPEGEFAHNLMGFGARYMLPLYTGGRLTAQIALGEAAVRLAEDRVRMTKDDLIFNASATYYTILRLREDLKAVDGSIEALEGSRRVVESLVEVKKEPKVTLFKINTRLAAVRQARIQVANALEQAYGALNALMGAEDITQRVNVLGVLEYVPQQFDLRGSIRQALERNPHYQARQKAVEIQGQQVKIAFSERLPHVSLRFTYQGFTSDTLLTHDEQRTTVLPDATLGVMLSMPIFDGKVLRSRVAEQEAELARAKAEVEDLQRQVAQAVQAAYLDLTSSEERIRAAQTALEEAQEARRIEQLKLEVGKGIVEDLLIAQAAELEAQQNYFRAVADHTIARAGLQRAIGGSDVTH